MRAIKLLSPAKLNLYLHINGVRNDGYHLLTSIIQPVDLFDDLLIETEYGDEIEFVVNGDKSIPSGNDNIVVKAAMSYLEIADVKSRIFLKLNKNIPAQAGLGGGSSNAAATLYGLNKIFRKLDDSELFEIALKLGADVPFFLNCRSSLVEGIGDKLTTINNFPLLNYLILKPSFGLSTKQVYKKWDCMNTSSNTIISHFDFDEYLKAFKAGNYKLVNDLEKPAIHLDKRIRDIKNMLISLGCEFVSMTGSGSAIYAIIRDQSDARHISEFLDNSFEYKIFLCKGISGWHILQSD